MTFLGAILAGGNSSRFGSDKALADIDGVPAWARQRHVLLTAGANPVVLIRRPDQEAPPGVDCWRDTFSEIGPIAGLHAALAKCGRDFDFVAVLAVDMPFVSSEWFSQLQQICAVGVGVIAQHEQIFEPLAAIYPREVLATVESQIEQGRHSLQALAKRLRSEGSVKIVQVNANEVGMLASRNSATATI